jgi:hypothetical protein
MDFKGGRVGIPDVIRNLGGLGQAFGIDEPNQKSANMVFLND